MLDNIKIGRLLYKLRIEKGLNQQELASIMNVSHQAVSKWENGQAIPDTQTLLALSRLYSISIEDILLGNKRQNEAAEEVAQLEKASSIELPCSSTAESENPQNDTDSENIENDTSEFQIDISKLDLGSFSSLIACIDQEICEKLVRVAIREKKYDYMVEALPFISSKTAGEILELAANDGNSSLLNKILPFANSESIDRAMLKLAKGNSNLLCLVFPFASRESISKLLNEISLDDSEFDYHRLVNLAPFASADDLSRLFIKLKDKNPQLLILLAPFVNSDAIDTVMNDSAVPDNIKRTLSPFAGSGFMGFKSFPNGILSNVKSFVINTLKNVGGEMAREFNQEFHQEGSKENTKEDEKENAKENHEKADDSRLLKRLKSALENGDDELIDEYVDELSANDLYALIAYANEKDFSLDNVLNNIDDEVKLECISNAVKNDDLRLARKLLGQEGEGNFSLESFNDDEADSKTLRRLKSALENNDDELIDEYAEELSARELYRLMLFSFENGYDTTNIVEHADEETLFEALVASIKNDRQELARLIAECL